MNRHTMSPWLRRGFPVGEERGSLAMVMLVVIVGMGLAALMLPLVLTQTHTTTFDSTRGRALQAAESGVDIATGAIRAATTDGAGDVTKLPCGPLTGVADPDSGTGSTYTATLQYFTADPKGHDNDTTWQAANAVACSPSTWTASAPRFVQITAVGVEAGTSRSRTLVATYALAVPLYTGFIRLYNNQSMCLTAIRKNQAPALAPCGTAATMQQFVREDSKIVLVSEGWCVGTDGGSGNASVGQCTKSWITDPAQSEPVDYQQLWLSQPDAHGTQWCIYAESEDAGAGIKAVECTDPADAADPGVLQAWVIDIDPGDGSTDPSAVAVVPGLQNLYEK
jgi:hypothetical protein